MNNRRRSIRRAVRSSLYWSTMWEIAEGYPDTAAEILADFDFDRGKLLRTVETMRGRRGPLWDLASALKSPTSPADPSAGTDPLKKQNRPLAGPS